MTHLSPNSTSHTCSFPVPNSTTVVMVTTEKSYRFKALNNWNHFPCPTLVTGALQMLICIIIRKRSDSDMNLENVWLN